MTHRLNTLERLVTILFRITDIMADEQMTTAQAIAAIQAGQKLEDAAIASALNSIGTLTASVSALNAQIATLQSIGVDPATITALQAIAADMGTQTALIGTALTPSTPTPVPDAPAPAV